MDDVWPWIVVLLVVLFIGERLIVTHDPRGVARMVGFVLAWLVLTGVSLAVVHSFVFVTTTAIFFSGGPVFAILGGLFSVAVLAATPVVCAIALRRGIRWLWADGQPNA
jgi:hypothetical protein